MSEDRYGRFSNYQTRIDLDNNVNDDDNKKEILDLFIQNVNKPTQNYIIDEEDEQNYEIIEKVEERTTSITYKYSIKKRPSIV